MPRPKPKKGSRTFFASSHALSDEAKRELIDLLGFDCPLHGIPRELGKALSDVELCLGAYHSAVEAMDNAPRAADYCATLTPIRRRAFHLANDLENLNGWMRDALAVRGVKVGDVTGPLATLVDAAGVAVREYSSTESRGQPQKSALRDLIGKLRAIFAHYYCGNLSTRRDSGAVAPLSEQEGEEVEFIKVALRDAGISCPTNIRRYFRGGQTSPGVCSVAAESPAGLAEGGVRARARQ